MYITCRSCRSSAANGRSARHHLAEHHRQHSTVAQVLDIGLVVEPAAHAESASCTTVGYCLDFDPLTRLEPGLTSSYRACLGSVAAEGAERLSGLKLLGQEAHHRHVAAGAL